MAWLTLTNAGGLDERSRIPNQLILEAENLGLAHDGFLVMRPGLGGESVSGTTFDGPIQWLGRFVTTAGDTENWAAAENTGSVAVLARKSSGSWSTVTYSDTVTVNGLRYHHAATLNGKYFLAYDSDVNRLHVWDGTTLRRVGIDKPSAPTAADTGAGAYGANARRYRVQFGIVSGSDVIALSELSASVAFTPSGGGAAARVTKPTTVDSATHWRVYGIAGSTDTYSSYQLLSAWIAVGTTIYDDSTAPASYSGDAPAVLGTNIPPPSAKFLLSDGARLLMAGAWESSGTSTQTAPKHNRVWFTRVLGTTDQGDDESIPSTTAQKNWIDVGDGGRIVALAGPLFGDVWVLKDDSVWKLVPTGDVTTPYSRVCVSKHIGAVSQRTTVEGDANGAPTIFFAGTNKLYQIAGGGITEISQPIARDLRAANFTLEQSVIGYSPSDNQLFLNVTTSAPTIDGAYYQFTFDTTSSRWSGVSLGGALSGWILGVGLLGISTVLGESGAFVRAMALGEASDGLTRLLLAGQDTAAAPALVSWGTVLGADNDASFAARVRWRSLIAEGRMVRVGTPTVIYRNPTGDVATVATLTLSYVRDDGETRSQSKTLSAQTLNSSLAITRLTFEGLEMADTQILDVRATLSYDEPFTGAIWPGVDAIEVPYWPQEELSR